MENPTDIKTEFEKENLTLHITVPGDILSTNSETLRETIFSFLDAELTKTWGWKVLRLNLSAAKMIDSTGLNLLISLVKSVKNRGGRLGVTISSLNIHRTFLFTRLDTQLDLTIIEPAKTPEESPA